MARHCFGTPVCDLSFKHTNTYVKYICTYTSAVQRSRLSRKYEHGKYIEGASNTGMRQCVLPTISSVSHEENI